MTSLNSIRSLNFHAFFYQRFETISIMWQKDKTQFTYTRNKREYLRWSISTFLALALGNGSCIYLILHEFITPERMYPIEYMLIQIALSVFAKYWLVVYVSSILFGSNFVCVWNSARNLLVRVRLKYSCKYIIYRLFVLLDSCLLTSE